MKIDKRTATAIIVVVAAGATAFMIGRYLISGDSVTQAQVRPDATPAATEVPHPDIIARETAVSEDSAKPLFVGELNGIQFVQPGTNLSGASHSCSSSELEEVVDSAAESALQDSDIDFEVSSLPSDLKAVPERATLCKGDVVAVGRAYEGSSGRHLSIVRSKQEPVVEAIAPRDRLEGRVVGGRSAVVVRSIFNDDMTYVLMHDEAGETFWSVLGLYIDEATLIRIAEELN